MNALKRMREGKRSINVPDRKRVKQEMSQLYKSKSKRLKGKGTCWKHKFVCLSYTDQEKIPTTDFDKEELFQAGLGEKQINFDDIDINQEDFKDVILDTFPRIEGGGGFRFMKGKFI